MKLLGADSISPLPFSGSRCRVLETGGWRRRRNRSRRPPPPVRSSRNLLTSLRTRIHFGRSAGCSLGSSAPKRTPARAQAQVEVVGATPLHDGTGGSASTTEKSSNPDALEVMTNTAAFIPFSYGPANCAGRYLALLIQRFEICFALQPEAVGGGDRELLCAEEREVASCSDAESIVFLASGWLWIMDHERYTVLSYCG